MGSEGRSAPLPAALVGRRTARLLCCARPYWCYCGQESSSLSNIDKISWPSLESKSKFLRASTSARYSGPSCFSNSPIRWSSSPAFSASADIKKAVARAIGLGWVEDSPEGLRLTKAGETTVGG